jgi:hypothetical protein
MVGKEEGQEGREEGEGEGGRAEEGERTCRRSLSSSTSGTASSYPVSCQPKNFTQTAQPAFLPSGWPAPLP